MSSSYTTHDRPPFTEYSFIITVLTFLSSFSERAAIVSIFIISISYKKTDI